MRAAVRVKGINLDVDELLSLDQASRELQREPREVAGLQLLLAQPAGQVVIAVRLRALRAPYAHAALRASGRSRDDLTDGADSGTVTRT